MNKTIKGKRIRQGSACNFSLYTEIHEDDSYLMPFILESMIQERKSLVLLLKGQVFVTDFNIMTTQSQPQQSAFKPPDNRFSIFRWIKCFSNLPKTNSTRGSTFQPGVENSQNSQVIDDIFISGWRTEISALL